MDRIAFHLNGDHVCLTDINPTETLLNWLREERGLTGTKEGCNEGDCGVCTVIVTDAQGSRAMNACILFLPQLDGKAVRTVEGLAAPDGTLHPVQQAMIDHHGSQCGFCTPGFVMSMAAAHLNGARDHDDQLAGNLCRCTGYAAIIRAAEAVADVPVPAWMGETLPRAEATEPRNPRSLDEFATWYEENPDATLIAGATDVGLWVTKALRTLGPVAFLNGIEDLRKIDVGASEIWIGAGVTLTDLLPLMADHHPSFAELIRRYGSVQVRNAATVGGNIANGSPIGDSPPALIALGATLHLRKGAARRSMPLEDFFVDYGKQDREPGEFVEGVSIPRQKDTLHCYKLSKRFDQDISAVCGCFNIKVEDGEVASVRIAFGGMAGTPKRATTAERALEGESWNEQTMMRAIEAMAEDFTPLSDMRASSGYRLLAAQNMLKRVFEASRGANTSVLEVRA